MMFAAVGCNNNNAVQVQLSAHESADKDLLGLEIDAQITGPQTGLHYKWFTMSGECDPQESDSPVTTFKFAENTDYDVVTLEVWNDGKCIAKEALHVNLDAERLRVEAARELGLKIRITDIPPYDANGGSSTHAAIAGIVSGKFGPDDKVIVYARAADVWYIQPMVNSFEAVSSDGTWTNWTHTGCNYAALLVRPGYYPDRRLDVLPPVGGYVVARTIVDGIKK